jgi:hypothetical protein
MSPLRFPSTSDHCQFSLWLFDKIPIDSGLPYLGYRSPHAMHSRAGKAALSFVGEEALNINPRNVIEPP